MLLIRAAKGPEGIAGGYDRKLGINHRVATLGIIVRVVPPLPEIDNRGSEDLDILVKAARRQVGGVFDRRPLIPDFVTQLLQ